MREEYKEMGYWFESNMAICNSSGNMLFITTVYYLVKVITTVTSTGWELDVNVNDIIKSHIRDTKLKSIGI